MEEETRELERDRFRLVIKRERERKRDINVRSFLVECRAFVKDVD